MTELLLKMYMALLYLNGLKSVLGFRFPWEKCSCCGKPWKEHVPSDKEVKQDHKEYIEKQLDDLRVNTQYPQQPGKHQSRWIALNGYFITYNTDKLCYEVYCDYELGVGMHKVFANYTALDTAHFLLREGLE